MDGNDFLRLLRKVSLEFSHFGKGSEWGQALAKYANEFPTKKGSERLLITAVHTMISSVDRDYRSTREKRRVDPETGKLIPR